MDINSTTPRRSPRNTYGRLRDAAIVHHDTKKRWELRSSDPHTKSERQRLADAQFQARWAEKLASLGL